MAPNHAPGARFSYSDTDYAARDNRRARRRRAVTRRPCASDHRPARPARDRAAERVTACPAPALRGYSRRGGRLHDTTAFNAELGRAGRGIVSTTGDLDRFAAALAGGRLLSPASLALMRGDATEARNRYGLGLRRWRTPCGRTVDGHDGGCSATPRGW